MLKASFVIPWYGREIPGGAEAECRGVAENLAARGVPVEVLTTCLHSHGRSWDRDHHPPGETVEGGVTVRRFPIDPRNAQLFNLLNSRILAGSPLPPRQELAFLENMVNSRALYQFIAEARDRLFFPLPYLFSTSWTTARLAPAQTIPVACLHDEGYAYLSPLRRAYAACAGVAFLSRAEERLARDLWGLEEERCHLIGAGVDTDRAGSSDKFRAKYQIKTPFILYAGRRDATKNTPFLIDCFAEYKKARPKEELRLVLIGDQPVSTPPGLAGEIIDLGFISKEDKADAFAAASIFCQPSVNESFSIVIMESWLNHTPVLVHRGCAVTREHAEESGGGLTFADPAGFVQAVDFILEDQAQAFALAEAGRRYVVRNYSWDAVCAGYVRLLEEAEERFGPGPKRPPQGRPKPKLRQVVPAPDPGADILGESWSIAHYFSEAGHGGGVYAPDREARPHSGVRPLRWLADDLGGDDLVLVHYDYRGQDPGFLEEVLAIPCSRLLIRPQGQIAGGPQRLEELAALLTLEGGRTSLFMARTETEKKILEQAGPTPAMVVPPVAPMVKKRAVDHNYTQGRMRLLHVSDSQDREGSAVAAAAFRLAGRLLPGALFQILEEGSGMVPALRPASASSRAAGAISRVVCDPPDLLEALSGAWLALLPGVSEEYGWAKAQLYGSKVPVLHVGRETNPALVAEEICALVEDQGLQDSLVQAQAAEFQEKGADQAWARLWGVAGRFWPGEAGTQAGGAAEDG